jgi:hypothetical protein
VLRNG